MIGAYYYPEQWPEEDWDGDLKRMREMGMLHVHMAEFAWTHMEPEEGVFDFTWLDTAVELAEKHDLDIILCTPSATPPVWLTEDYPDSVMKLYNGRMAAHGSRGHGCVNSPVFNAFAERIAEKLAKRYGKRERVIGWQLDNEIGHYGKAPCYCSHCMSGFQEYLKERYGSVDALNKAWAGDFWSQNYQRFDQVRLPNNDEVPYIANEHARLDHLRFFSESQARFLERQALVLRRHIRDEAWITHNFMTDDPFVHPRHVRSGIEMFTLTNYPVAGMFTGKEGTEHFRVGDPVNVGFHHDFTRCHNGRWGVMEQQPGQVNWGPYNTRPLDGSTRLWLWTAVAHGAELLDTYRFRQPRCGAEQYHEGLIALDGETQSRGGREFAQVARELEELTPYLYGECGKDMPRAAILHDWDSLRALEIHPQSDNFSPMQQWKHYYAALKSMGLHVDVLSADAQHDFSKYDLVCVPFVDLATDEMVASWRDYAENGGCLLISPRVATRDRLGHFPQMHYAQRAADLSGGAFIGYDILPEDRKGTVRIGASGETTQWNCWAEQWRCPPDGKRLAVFADQFYAGECAAFTAPAGKGTVTVIGVADGEVVSALVRQVAGQCVDKAAPLPESVLVQTCGDLAVILNYNPYAVRAESCLPQWLRSRVDMKSPLVGEIEIAPAGVAVWKMR